MTTLPLTPPRQGGRHRAVEQPRITPKAARWSLALLIIAALLVAVLALCGPIVASIVTIVLLLVAFVAGDAYVCLHLPQDAPRPADRLLKGWRA